MGQRLGIAVKQENKIQAFAYYHWAGNTECASELVSTILKCEFNGSPLENAIQALQLTEAEVLGTENANRNDGIIYITEAGIQSMIDEVDHFITVDLDNRVVEFDMFYDNDLDFMDEEEFEDFCVTDTREIDIDHTAVPFDRWEEFAKFIAENDSFSDYTDTGDDSVIIWSCILG